MPRTALFAGSFDPVTNGHLDLVRQAARLADRLVLAIGTHPGKTPLFTTEERLAMLEETCAPLARAAGCELNCTTFADLVVTAAQREGATLLIRGLRSGSRLRLRDGDGGHERRHGARRADGVPAGLAARSARSPPHWCGRSPRMGGDVSPFVPPPVAARLKAKFAGKTGATAIEESP